MVRIRMNRLELVETLILYGGKTLCQKHLCMVYFGSGLCKITTLTMATFKNLGNIARSLKRMSNNVN